MQSSQRLASFRERLRGIDQEIRASAQKLEEIKSSQVLSRPRTPLKTSQFFHGDSNGVLSPKEVPMHLESSHIGRDGGSIGLGGSPIGLKKSNYFVSPNRNAHSKNQNILEGDQSSILSSLYMEIDRSINNEKALEIQEIEASYKQKEDKIKSDIFKEEMTHKETIKKIKGDFLAKKAEHLRQYKYFLSNLKAKAKEAIEQEKKRVSIGFPFLLFLL